MSRILLSDSSFVSVIKVIFALFGGVAFLYLLIFPQDFLVWFLFLFIGSLLIFKIKIHKFKDISFDEEFIYINKERYYLSQIEELSVSFFSRCFVKIKSKKYYFSITMYEYSRNNKIDKLKKCLPDPDVLDM